MKRRRSRSTSSFSVEHQQARPSLTLRLLVGLLLASLSVLFTRQVEFAPCRALVPLQTYQQTTYQYELLSRPRDLRLIFMGDSVTRYQYLSLAYYLRYGHWLDPTVKQNNLVNSHSFHHPLHPDEDWNEFFLQSNRMLFPMEVCDCLRNRESSVVLERRYFHDEEYNNILVYINMSGNVTYPLDRGHYGRLDASDIFGTHFHNLVGLPVGLDLAESGDSTIAWEYETWGDVLRYHVRELGLGDNVDIVLNAGLHPHSFDDPVERQDVLFALADARLNGIWKTTTYSRSEIIASEATEKDPTVRSADAAMCQELHRCFDLRWTFRLRPSIYFDNLHFLEPVYRILNEELLEMISKLPLGYQKMDRSLVLENPR